MALLGNSFPRRGSGAGAGDAGLSAPAWCSLSWGQRCYVNWLSYRNEVAPSAVSRTPPDQRCTGCVCLEVNSWTPSSNSLHFDSKASPCKRKAVNLFIMIENILQTDLGAFKMNFRVHICFPSPHDCPSSQSRRCNNLVRLCMSSHN